MSDTRPIRLFSARAPASEIIAALSDSARDFQDIVWPQVSRLPLVGGGTLRPVEAVAASNFRDELDLLAGIDAWQIQHSSSGIRGLASRVQWGRDHDSFSIRLKLPSGKETEYHKRLHAIERKDEGFLFPHLTIQAFLDKKGGRLLSAAAIKTEDLMAAAQSLVERKERDHLKNCPKLYGFKRNADGSEFVFMAWEYLQFIMKLDAKNVVHPVRDGA
ncbi:hypothetical protein [Caldimonas brevitalea]|uniref:Uncharacterized protein n=1 Tax=Caldimonas brevitalea TaxID=413882 RepID=A0A0G3BMU4_9BURK|nr:hypothetical protein [Caldimonas brevitalea]AKJ28711.1 hypothetical protein AAW51_2020 [Caldimonas brevitalea]